MNFITLARNAWFHSTLNIMTYENNNQKTAWTKRRKMWWQREKKTNRKKESPKRAKAIQMKPMRIAWNVKWQKTKWNVKLKVKHLNRHETRNNMLLVFLTVHVQFAAHDLIEFCGWMNRTRATENSTLIILWLWIVSNGNNYIRHSSPSGLRNWFIKSG